MKSNYMKYLSVMLLLFISLGSCNKSADLNKEPSCEKGYIYWGGDYSVDGIGWYFTDKREGNWKFKQLKEADLPGEFKNITDSTFVSICLEKTEERAPCFCLEPSYFYKIISVKKLD